MNVEDIMSRDPVVAESDASVGEVLEILQGVEFRHLPIVDGKELVGMVSERDLRALEVPRSIDEASISKHKALLRRPISDVMSSDVISVGPEASVSEVVDLMLDNKVGAVPVVDEINGDLVGIVSYIDVLRQIGDALD